MGPTCQRFSDCAGHFTAITRDFFKAMHDFVEHHAVEAFAIQAQHLLLEIIAHRGAHQLNIILGRQGLTQSQNQISPVFDLGVEFLYCGKGLIRRQGRGQGSGFDQVFEFLGHGLFGMIQVIID